MSTIEVMVEMRRRTQSSDDPRRLHESFVSRMRTIGPPWWDASVNVEAPNVESGDLEVQVNLSDALPPNAIGYVAYVHRGPDYLRDEALYDDRFVLRFQVDETSYRILATEAFRSYVTAFQPYRARIVLDRDLALEDWDAAIRLKDETGSDEDGRHGLVRIWPVCFIDNRLCKSAFGTTAVCVCNTLAQHVESIEMLDDGVLVVATSRLVQRDEIRLIDRRLRDALANR